MITRSTQQYLMFSRQKCRKIQDLWDQIFVVRFCAHSLLLADVYGYKQRRSHLNVCVLFWYNGGEPIVEVKQEFAGEVTLNPLKP
eukprot:m.208797 g.208797  ORF g.208797 m.208797 type:complete len:85 (+) comp33022_c5_seq5:675-929(+)